MSLAEPKPRKKVGRPRKDPTSLRLTYTSRMSGRLHALLRTEADKAGRSLSEEVEHRLEQSFDREALLAQVREAVRPQPVERWGEEVTYPVAKNGYLPS